MKSVSSKDAAAGCVVSFSQKQPQDRRVVQGWGTWTIGLDLKTEEATGWVHWGDPQGIAQVRDMPDREPGLHSCMEPEIVGVQERAPVGGYQRLGMRTRGCWRRRQMLSCTDLVLWTKCIWGL